MYVFAVNVCLPLTVATDGVSGCRKHKQLKTEGEFRNFYPGQILLASSRNPDNRGSEYFKYKQHNQIY